jgi:hypothetical protein
MILDISFKQRLFAVSFLLFCICLNDFAQTAGPGGRGRGPGSKFRNDTIQYLVSGAGTADVNGIYKPSGIERGYTVYSNGKYKLYYRGCHSKWMIEGPNGHNMYRNFVDSVYAPYNKWEKACGKEALEPAPVIDIVKPDNKAKK